MSRTRLDDYGFSDRRGAPKIFVSRRPPAVLSEDEARAIGGAARPLGELHALFYDSHVQRPPDDRRGPYRRPTARAIVSGRPAE